jgi:Na+-driven multidrug efflux pump
VGQNWGAKKIPRAREGVRTATVMSLVSTAVLGLMVFLLARPLMNFFSPEEEVIDYGIRFIRIVTPFYIAICFNQIYAGALRGVGDATMPTVIMLASFVVFRQIYLAVTKALGAGFLAVALAYPVGWILCSTLLIIRYSRSVLVRPKPETAEE